MLPSRILLEMLLIFMSFFLPGYLLQTGAASAGPLSTLTMLQVIVTGLPQFLLMAYIAGVSSPSPSGRWGLVPLKARDALRTALLLLGCFAVVAPFVALVLSLPPSWSRPLASGYRWSLQSPAQIPLAILFGLTAGYREEFFFRSYLLGRLGELGAPLPLAAVLSTALFAMGHVYEGPMGIAIAAALGTLLCLAYMRRPNLHVVAIAHGLYNAIVLCLSFAISRALPAAQVMRIFSP